jgi:hypothetical protein
MKNKYYYKLVWGNNQYDTSESSLNEAIRLMREILKDGWGEVTIKKVKQP